MKLLARMRAVAFVTALALVFTTLFGAGALLLAPGGGADPYAYAEPTAPQEAFAVYLVGKDGAETVAAAMHYDPTAGALRMDGTGAVPPRWNDGTAAGSPDFAGGAGWSDYGVLTYSGKNRAAPRLGLVRSGFTLDGLRDLVAQRTGAPLAALGTDAAIRIRGTGLPYLDISALDDVPRYWFPSFLKEGSLWGTSFDMATAREVPIVFACESHIKRDFLGYGTDALLDAAIRACVPSVSAIGSMRLFFGQEPGDNEEENLGSLSIYNVYYVSFGPAYRGITARGIGIRTADGYLTAACGETVSFTATTAVKDPTKVTAQPVSGGAYLKVSYNAASKQYSFTMPGEAVYVGVGPFDYRIRFDARGGTKVPDKTVEAGKAVGGLPYTVRAGYRFLGWYTKKTGGTKITEKTKPTKDATWYAHWKALKYKVKLNVNGGKKLKKTLRTKTVTFGKKYGKLPAPTRKGYTFKGWYTKKKGGKRIKAGTKVTTAKSQTLYARWKKK